jgi:hypothetical protein
MEDKPSARIKEQDKCGNLRHQRAERKKHGLEGPEPNRNEAAGEDLRQSG